MREEQKKHNENNLLILLFYKVRRTDINDSLKNIKSTVDKEKKITTLIG